MSEEKETRELAQLKAKEDLSEILKAQYYTPYELMKKKLEDLHFQQLKQGAESAMALSEMQTSYQQQIEALKKQLARREEVHKSEIAAEKTRYNEMVENYTTIIEDLNKNGRTEIR